MGNSASESTASFRGREDHHHNTIGVNSFDSLSVDQQQQESFDDLQDDNFGWYEDTENMSTTGESCLEEPLRQALTVPEPASEPPMYVLESSLEAQQLWYMTAGQRPQQPTQEREAIEKDWMNNFNNSKINHSYMSSNTIQSCSDISIKSKYQTIQRGASKLSNSVSMSFSNEIVSSMTIQMPSYRIIRNEFNYSEHAEYLIMITLGGRGGVPFGIWKRHSHFESLAVSIQDMNPHSFHKTLLSWECIQRHKRWFRSFDVSYLELKCHLLERFMHDLLCETHSSTIICNFLGLQ